MLWPLSILCYYANHSLLLEPFAVCTAYSRTIIGFIAGASMCLHVLGDVVVKVAGFVFTVTSHALIAFGA
jgi:hypothetical protein